MVVLASPFLSHLNLRLNFKSRNWMYKIFSDETGISECPGVVVTECRVFHEMTGKFPS